jgi:hypothetical protein
MGNTISIGPWLLSAEGTAAILSVLGTFIAVFVAQWLKGGVKLIVFSPNSTNFKIRPTDPSLQEFIVNSGQIVVQNEGRRSATDVQITSRPGVPPAGYVLIPSIVHTIEPGPQGEWVLKVPYLGPKENLAVQLLNGPVIDSVRCAEGAAKYVDVMHQRVYPTWFNITVIGLLIWGLCSALYVIISSLL